MAQKPLSRFIDFTRHNMAVVGITMSTTLVFAFATLYLRENLHVSNFLVGVAAGLSHVVSVFLSPVAGTLSDRSKSRWGRRRPFIVGGAVFAGASIATLPHITNYWLFLVVLSVFFVFSVGYQIPFYALIPEVAPEGSRGAYVMVIGLLRLIGFALVMGLGGWLWTGNPAWLFYITGATIVLTALVTAASLKDKDAHPLPEEDKLSIFRNIRRYLADLSGYKNVMFFFAAQLLWWLGLGAVMPFATIILKELYGLEISELVKMTPLVIFAGAILVGSIIISGILGDRWGHRRVVTAGLSILAVGAILAFFARSAPLLGLSAFVVIIGIAPLFNEPFALLAELTPKGREGEFYGLDTISITLSQVPGALIGGAVIDAFGYSSIYLFTAANVLMAILFMRLQRAKHPKRENLR